VEGSVCELECVSGEKGLPCETMYDLIADNQVPA
jgi:hypothetical protein